MSSDLIDLDTDENGTDIFLSMNVYGYASLILSSQLGVETYTFNPKDTAPAITLARALIEWANHVKEDV